VRIGVLGVGHLASAIVGRLMATGWPASGLILSPRGQGPALAARFGLEVASGNAELVNDSDAVLLAVRPGDAEAAVRGLPWQDRHIIVSACAGVASARLQEAAGPVRVMRIMPLTAMAFGASPTTVFPEIVELRPALERLGTVLPLRSEVEFETATVTAAVYGWAQELIRQTTDWLGNNGLDPGTARQLTALTFAAAGRLTAESPEQLHALLESIATPGGITELGLRRLDYDGVPDAWRAACDAVLAKLTGRAG
jgi:pyrroline-5-carboxylate reductase